MVNYVRENGGFPKGTLIASQYDANDRWSVMCAAAGAHAALLTAVKELSSWEVPKGASAAAESHRVVDYLAHVQNLLSKVSNSYDPLRAAVTKHKLPWHDSLTTEVRFAAQNTAVAVMTHALDSFEHAERVKGPWQRQAVLKPLGHGVEAAFAVHQLAGGFSTEPATICDILVDRMVHYARLIDPKWFRGHKVVSQ